MKDLDEDLRNYETKAEDNKESYIREKKVADDVDAELLSRQRKVRKKS